MSILVANNEIFSKEFVKLEDLVPSDRMKYPSCDILWLTCIPLVVYSTIKTYPGRLGHNLLNFVTIYSVFILMLRTCHQQKHLFL